MAVAAYYNWDRLGRPLEPATPIRELVERLRVTFPRAAAAKLLSWYANEAHYTAVPAQDHTPFSQTGWPLPCPQWVVFATDVMHRPDLGVDCGVLFKYWLAEARAGRMPWLKYMIWQATLYDVRYGWKPQANSGHFDHIHLSVRTDHQNTHLGSWSVVPGGDDMPLTDQDKAAVRAAAAGGFADAMTAIAARADGWRPAANAFNAAVRNALGLAPEALSGLLPKLDAILAAAQDDDDVTVTMDPAVVAQLQQAIADLRAGVKADLAAAAHAEADALDQ